MRACTVTSSAVVGSSARQLGLGKQLDGTCLGFVLAERSVQQQRFYYLIAAGQHWVQGGHRLLKNHADVVAPHFLQLRFSKLEQVYLAQLFRGE
jgi:hypothetical protein